MLGMFGIKKKKAGKKVLIVEDDFLLARIMSERFLAEKIEVVVVGNGLKVREVARSFLPDIILLDLIIPGIDGFAVLKQLRSDKKTKNISVAVISNLDDIGDIKSTKALGVDEYFIKSNTDLEKIIDYVKNK